MPHSSKGRRSHTTNLGRVVYDRQIHFFTDKDVVRIFKSRFSELHDLSFSSRIEWLLNIYRLEFDLFLAFLGNLSNSDLGKLVRKTFRGTFDFLWPIARRVYDSVLNFITDTFNEWFGPDVDDSEST